MFWIGTLPSLSTQVHHAPHFYSECARFKYQSENKLFWHFIIVFPIPSTKKWKSIPISHSHFLPNLFQLNTHWSSYHNTPLCAILTASLKKHKKKSLSVLLCHLVFIMAIAWPLILILLHHLYCHALHHQAIILPPFCVLSFLLIHETLAAISSLKSMTLVILTTYLNISPLQQVIKFQHNMPIQPDTKRVKLPHNPFKSFNIKLTLWGKMVAKSI
jgi:hypothetical protein